MENAEDFVDVRVPKCIVEKAQWKCCTAEA